MKPATVRKFAMSLPEVTEEPHHDYGSFRVRGKIFVTMPPGEQFIHVFVPEETREQSLIFHRLWKNKADGAVVERLVREAWQYKAPKGLVEARRTEVGGIDEGREVRNPLGDAKER